MNCPICGKEMEKGRMTAGGYWIRWIPEGCIDMIDAVTISRQSLFSKGIPAYNCQTCHKIVADY